MKLIDDDAKLDVQAITFDLDDTLWSLPPTLAKAEQEAYNWLKANAPNLTARFEIDALRSLVSSVVNERPDIRFQVSAIRKAVINKAAALTGHPEEIAQTIAEQAFDVFIHHRHDVEYFDGVVDTLSRLAKDFTIGAITNGNANIHQLSIGQFFSFNVSADLLGIAKPDRRIFDKAASLAGVHAKQIAHVGDSLHYDVHGANAAGYLSVWANYGNEEKEQALTETTKPDATINDIRLLNKLLINTVRNDI